MQVSLEQWARCLQSTQDVGTGPRCWIYEIYNGQGFRTVTALSASRPGSRKLTFGEIVSISQQMMNVKQKFDGKWVQDPMEYVVKRDIAQTMQAIDVFSVDAAKLVQEELEDTKDLCDIAGSVSSNLENMYLKSKKRREDEKVSSLWGRIKWYIWSFFADKGKRVQEVKDSSPVYKGCFNAAMKDRMFINLLSFEEEIGLPEAERSKDGEYDTPAKVRKSWLTRFSEDTYKGPVSTQADNNRKRVVAMLKIWEDVIRFEGIEEDEQPDIDDLD